MYLFATLRIVDCTLPLPVYGAHPLGRDASIKKRVLIFSLSMTVISLTEKRFYVV